MAIYSYNEITSELITNSVISDKDVYDFSTYQYPSVFSNLFQFCQENLTERCADYNIQPAKFYFTNHFSTNAQASFSNGYYLIKVDMGGIHRRYELFCKNDILNDSELAYFKRFNTILRRESNVGLDHLMFQYSTLFTYYHELGHLIQFANRNEGNIIKNEEYNQNNETNFNILNHIIEYDADQHAGNRIAFHVIYFWQSLIKKNRTNYNLKNLIVAALVAIMGYICLLWKSSKTTIYFNKNDHPHPLIRMFWIMATIVDTARINMPSTFHLSQREIIDETLKVLNIYSTRIDSVNIKTLIIEPLRENYLFIKAYSNHILRLAEHYDFLAINTVHQR